MPPDMNAGGSALRFKSQEFDHEDAQSLSTELLHFPLTQKLPYSTPRFSFQPILYPSRISSQDPISDVRIPLQSPEIVVQ